MNKIYLYKLLWLTEVLIFINLCNDIYAFSTGRTSPEEVKRHNKLMLITACKRIGFFEKTEICFYKRCIDMLSNLEPKLKRSDMEKLSNYVKPWRINIPEATELLNILINYKWGVTEYGLFLQELNDRLKKRIEDLTISL
ncbi:uncharacterized protein LOC142334138 isoform X2 [Lycorma delicatula]|uniref:uncharacterized protein LOC142334138 isoform X2 n=1 Tax=Lycorma delicatula TaxID=130591 RepID=UPI003F510D1B